MVSRFTAATLCPIALVALLASAGPLRAHGPPTPLDFWGDFGRRVARCQRLIARNAAVCALQAWEARRACRLTGLHGGSCDEDATDAAIEAARLAAVDRVGDACTDQQAQTLVFLDRREAQLDVVTFCRELEDAVDSAIFRPLVGIRTVPPQTARCVEAAALAATKLLRRGFDSRARLLDRIAQLSFAPSVKSTMVAESSAAIDQTAGGLGSDLSAACPAAAFAQTYGRDAMAVLDTIAARADCLAGQAYAQGGVVCPPPQCGNGMVEFQPVQDREECDDGNLVAGDGCSAACARE
jgi:cysteine-rich repeat protein